jgi:hypothetical protein
VFFTALLIISSLPVMSICFMLGSVDPKQVLSAYLEMLSASILIGAMGIMWSSMSRTTTQAVMMTYITLFVVFVFGWCVFIMRIAPFSSNAASTAYQAIGAMWFGGVFMGVHTPEGTGFVLFCLLSGVLMTAVASVRIEMFPHRKAYILRALTLLLFAVQFLAIDMAWTDSWYKRGGAAVMVAVHPPIGALMLTTMALLLLTPVFATGVLESFEARRFVKYILWGMTPEGLKRGKLASGIPFMMLITLLCLGVYALSFVFAGQRTAIARSGALSLGLPGVPPPEPPHLAGPHGETVTVTGGQVTIYNADASAVTVTKLPNGTVQVTTFRASGQTSVVIQSTWPATVPALPPAPPARTVVTPATGDFWQGAVALIVSIAGFGMLNVLFSVVFRRRWIAIVLAYVVLLLIFVIPEVAISFGTSGSGSAHLLQIFCTVCSII